MNDIIWIDQLNKLVNGFAAALNENFLALYRYPRWVERLNPDDTLAFNLLIVAADGVDWGALQAACREMWEDAGTAVPAVMQVTDFQRHMHLNPSLSYHIALHGELWYGSDQLPPLKRPSRQELLAPLLTQLITASAALVPALMEADRLVDAQKKLRELYFLRFTADAEQVTPEQQFAALQADLAPLALHALNVELDVTPIEDAPPLLPELLGLYEMGVQLLLLLPDMETSTLATSLNWEEVGEMLGGEMESVQISTPAQLWLSVAHDRASSIVLRAFQFGWGHDMLAALKPDRALVLRDAARLAGAIIPALSRDYLLWPEEKLGKLIHDYQNKLLNVGLEHELLHRLLQLPRQTADPLPEKGALYDERVAANLAQAAWWADCYLGFIDEA